MSRIEDRTRHLRPKQKIQVVEVATPRWPRHDAASSMSTGFDRLSQKRHARQDERLDVEEYRNVSKIVCYTKSDATESHTEHSHPKDSPASPGFPPQTSFPLPHNQKWDNFVGGFSPAATIILVLERDNVVWLIRYHHSVGRNARSGNGGLVL